MQHGSSQKVCPDLRSDGDRIRQGRCRLEIRARGRCVLEDGDAQLVGALAVQAQLAPLEDDLCAASVGSAARVVLAADDTRDGVTRGVDESGGGRAVVTDVARELGDERGAEVRVGGAVIGLGFDSETHVDSGVCGGLRFLVVLSLKWCCGVCWSCRACWRSRHVPVLKALKMVNSWM